MVSHPEERSDEGSLSRATILHGLRWAFRCAILVAGVASALATSDATDISGTKKEETCSWTFTGPNFTTLTLVVGQTATLTAQFTATCAQPVGVPGTTFSSQNSTIASVGPSTGIQTVVTGNAPGTTTVSVGGQSVSVKVLVAPVTMTLAPAAQTINQGQSATITATLRDGGGGVLTDPAYAIIWTPASTPVGTVTKTGDRTANVAGTAPGTITVTATAGTVTANAQVTVLGNTLTISPASASLVPTQTTTLTATLRDGLGNVITNSPVTWTSANTAVATVTPSSPPSLTATVTGVTVGGPVNVTATAGGVSTNVPITVTAVAGGRLAYALADKPTTASYTAAAANAFSSTSGAITITRSGPGVYAVNFDGQQTPSGKKETVLVTAVSTDLDVCRIAGWNSTATALVASIRCTDSDGDPDDQAFSILLLGNDALSGRFAFTLADQPSTTGTYTPAAATTFSSSNQPVTVSRGPLGLGSYTVSFAGHDRINTTDREAFLVSAVGNSSERCGASSSTTSIGAKVQCVKFDGFGVDSKFNMALVGNDPNHVLGFAQTVKDQNPTSTPPSASTFNKSGGSVTVTRSGFGRTDITFAGLATVAGTSVMNVQLNPADGSGLCKLLNWRVSGADVVASVQCYDRFESLDDVAYTILIVK